MFQKALIEPVEMTFTTHEKAVAFRVELYKYRYAIRDGLPCTRALYDDVMKITMSVQAKTLTLQTKKSKFVEKLNERT
jgi:hypothetical protein